jgi:ABC-type glycerol-3-phosphate transport system permease component
MTSARKSAPWVLPSPGRLLAIGFLAAVIVWIAAPIVYAVLRSFMTEAEARELPVHLIPRRFTIDNFRDVLDAGNLPRAFLNSVIVAALQVVFVLLTGSLAGYVFARKSFLGKNAVFLFVLVTTMVPFSMLLIPLYLTFTQLGLSNTYLGVVLPGAVSAFSIFLCRQYILGIPSELFDAATIDGATDVQVYTGLVVPLIRPLLAALSIFVLVDSVNSLLWPLVVLDRPDMLTLTLVLLSYAQGGLIGPDVTVVLAAAVLASLPLVIAFIFLQRQFTRGLALTSGFSGQ